MIKTIPIVKNNALIYVEVDLAEYLYEGQPIWERIHLFEIVETLPPTGTNDKIYFLENNGGGNNAYTEYVWLANKWEIIGNTNIDLEEDGNITINLSGFASKAFVNAAKEEAKAYIDSEIEKLDLTGIEQQIPDYSTEGVDTGIKWIDGSHIYRKVILGQAPAPGGKISYRIPGAQLLISAHGWFAIPGYPSAQIPFNAPSLMDREMRVEMDGGGFYNGIGIMNQSQGSIPGGTNFTLIVEYTK